MSETLSIPQLAKQVNRSRSAVHEWTQRQDWPFGASPWINTAEFVPMVLEWMESTVGNDDQLIDCPGPLAMKTADLFNPAHPLRLAKLIPDDDEQKAVSVDQLNRLVLALNTALQRVIEETAAEHGIADKLPARAPLGFWQRIAQHVDTNELIARFDEYASAWMAWRSGVLVDKPAKRKGGKR
jgi:hypothetical protein